MKAESVLRQLQEGVTLLISNLFDCFDPFFEHSLFFLSPYLFVLIFLSFVPKLNSILALRVLSLGERPLEI